MKKICIQEIRNVAKLPLAGMLCCPKGIFFLGYKQAFASFVRIIDFVKL